jgi:hypothetical protein
MTETCRNKKENWLSAYSSSTNNIHSANKAKSKYFYIAPGRSSGVASSGQYQPLQPKLWPNLTISHGMLKSCMIKETFEMYQ